MMDFKRLGHDVARAVGEGPDPAERPRQRSAVLAAARGKPSRGRRTSRAVGLGFLGAALTTVLFLVAPWQDTRVDHWMGDEQLEVGAELTSSAEAPSAVSFADGSQVSLRGPTRARVTRASGKQVAVKLERGRLEASVNPSTRLRWTFAAGRYEVRVTGTVFSVAFDPDADRLEIDVEHGSVLVSGPNLKEARRVGEGQRLGVDHDRVTFGAVPPVAEPPAANATPDAPHEVEQRPAPSHNGRSPRADAQESWEKLARSGSYPESLAAARAQGLDTLLARSSAAELALLADTARYARAPLEARQALAALEKRFPKSKQARLVPFLAARIAADLEADPKQAAQLFERYVRREPNGDLAQEARGRLIDVWQRIGDVERARAAAKHYLERHPDGPYAAIARELTAP